MIDGDDLLESNVVTVGAITISGVGNGGGQLGLDMNLAESVFVSQGIKFSSSQATYNIIRGVAHVPPAAIGNHAEMERG